MKINKQLFLNLYLVIAILHIYSLISDNEHYIVISKYLLMPMLILHVIVNCRMVFREVLPLIFALLFCWVGDVLLVYTDINPDLFILGLAAFLAGHILFIFSFNRFSEKKPTLLSKKPWLAIFPVIYSVILLVLIYPALGTLAIPVILYTAVITWMLIAAINRKGRTTQYSFLFVLGGALFFVGSDSVIAIVKFYSVVESSALIIMSTYIIAQYLITTGLLLHINDAEKE